MELRLDERLGEKTEFIILLVRLGVQLSRAGVYICKVRESAAVQKTVEDISVDGHHEQDETEHKAPKNAHLFL